MLLLLAKLLKKFLFLSGMAAVATLAGDKAAGMCDGEEDSDDGDSWMLWSPTSTEVAGVTMVILYIHLLCLLMLGGFS